MWNLYQTPEKQNLLQASTLQTLKDKGVLKIRINFSGSGDSGDIDDIEYIDMNDMSCWQQGYQGPEQSDVSDLTEQIRDQFFDFVDRQACKHGDWVNNEGGYGNVEIFTTDGSFHVEYYQRTVVSYSHEGESIYKQSDNLSTPYASMGQLPGTYS